MNGGWVLSYDVFTNHIKPAVRKRQVKRESGKKSIEITVLSDKSKKLQGNLSTAATTATAITTREEAFSMDPPYVHHSRYVNISSPNPNFYGPPPVYHPHHHLAPGHPPPPPPQSLPPPPPLPPPPHQPQFHHHPLPAPPAPPPPTMNPNFNPNPKPNNPNHHRPRSHDYSHIEDDRYHYRNRPLPGFESRPDLWDPPRVIPGHRHLINKSEHHQQFDHHPVSPYRSIENLRHELDGNYRFRERYKSDAFALEHNSSNNQRAEMVPHRNHFASDSERLNSGNYSNLHGTRFDDNELTRSNLRDGMFGRQSQREREIRDSSFEMGSKNENRGKRELHWSESGRYGYNRGSKENSYEYNRTPRKQIQKKSALLRIQKPFYRNRDDDEELQYSNHFDEISSYIDEDQILYTDHGVVEKEERKGSPVELDVSFKSNSLVAKAIVTPPSSAVVSDTNLTPKSGKIRKVKLSSKDFSSSQMNKLRESYMNLDSSEDVNSASGSSDKDLKQSEKEISPLVIHDMHNDDSQACSSGINDSLSKFTVERSKRIASDTRSTDVGSSKTSLLSVTKKKRVVKLKHTDTHVSSVQPNEKVDERVKKDGSTFNSPAATVPKRGKKLLKQKITSAGRASVRPPCQNEPTMLPKNGKIGGSPHTAMVSDQVSTDVNSGSSCVTKIKRKRNSSISPLASLHHRETKFDEGSENADNSICGLQTISNTDKDLTNSLNETIVSPSGSVEGVTKQFFHNEESLMPDNSDTKQSPKILSSVSRDINYDLLSSEEKKRHENHVDTCSVAHRISAATNFDDGLVNLQEKISDQAISSVDCNTVEGIPLAILPGRTSKIFAQSSSEEIGIHNVSIHSGRSIHDRGSDYVCINSEEINVETGEYAGKQLSLERFNSSVENDATEGLQNTLPPVGGGEENMSNTTNTSKVTTSQGLPDGTITDMDMRPVNAVSSAQCVDTTCVHTSLSLSVKDFNPAEATFSNSLDVSLLPCADEVTVLRESNLTCRFSKAKALVNCGFTSTSPEKSKRRKVFTSYPGFSNAMVSVISEGPAGTDLSMPSLEMPSNFSEGIVQPEQRTEVSKMDSLCTSGLPHCLDKTQVLCEDNSERLSSKVVVSVGPDAFRDRTDGLKIDQPRADSEDSDIPNAISGFPQGYRSEQTENAVTGINDNIEDMYTESKKEEKMKAVTGEDQVMTCSASQFKTPSQHPSPDLNQRLPSTYVDSNGYLEKDHLPSVSASMPLAAHGDGVSTTNSNDELMEFDTLSDIGTPEILSSVPVLQSLTCKESPNQISNELISGDVMMPNEELVIEGTSNLSVSPQYVKIDLKSNYAPKSAHSVAGRAGSLTSQDVKSLSHNLNLRSGETNVKKNQPNQAVSRTYPSCPSSVFTSKNTASLTHNTKPLTWHRSDKSSASPVPGNKPFSHTVPKQHQFSRKVAKFQSMSYIRKGNSLVRKPAPVVALPKVSHARPSSVYQLNSSGIGELKKSFGSDSMAGNIDMSNILRTGGVGAPVERPRTPPLPPVTKMKNCTTNSSGDCTSSPLAEPLPNSCSEATSDPRKFIDCNDVPNSYSDALKITEAPVNQTASVNSLESQGEPNDGTLATSNVMRITYVKRKSNQLVATPSHCGPPIQIADKTQGFISDGYYKRRKNQLIRSSAESHINRTVTLPDDNLRSEGKTAPKASFSKNFSKRQSYKVTTKICRPSRFSLVWTPSNMQSKKNDDHSSYRRKVMPYLIPWKRTGYRKCFMQNSASISNNSSLSAISRKLLLLRQRDAVYTRSGHGFSLRKSKVLSVGGSSLKWSKSIERRSKKANEEATLAVAAVGRKQGEQNDAASIVSRPKNRSHSSRERIFRIGSVRYKMDSSRRTLQRISDDESSHSAALNLEKNGKRSYIPRRLVIGNDEYVRIGNGNQLVRDPKKRTRVLASEKVRWSLHTARLRLARKRKYCQFFTRFGKCNKDDGKCPYIHDRSKIAVCTKFLNGLCSNSDCKLTHKVIPERMPDCSYFLQGLCTNKSCPYRHVHVNPNSSTCEGFLKGYCADGNECRKKHSYVCPFFEATGSCPQGSKCKLHHPKSQKKGKKSKRSRQRKNSRGRYFGSLHMDDNEPQIMKSERKSEQDYGDVTLEGNFADYITLAISGDEAGETYDAMNEQTTLYDSDNSDFQLDDLDELIKPIRIMDSMTK
ncbi:hypothetical protein Ddye_005946 [Dipteronia dyeriana]|uniref:C3H1-type domain-containing protein n=1 Tax=Dipteronia dyeriana TaxID=168575 RepID=A0AAE0CQQ4_9ROSI|nr:hypothetical protein Ddye_005946 [Dipteronia dyeriana]